MIKHLALTTYLLARELVAPEKVDSWTEQVSLTSVWKPDVEGLYLGDLEYTTNILLEEFGGDPARLMALICGWLENNDDDRDGLPGVQFDVDLVDSGLKLFDVSIKLQFSEPQHLAEDPEGEIEAFGERWSFVPFELWTAETGEVTSDGA